jgi:type IV secretory pathway VirJ component
MKTLLIFFSLIFFINSQAQQTMPVAAYKGTDPSKPLIFYISGDGGLNNSFSSALVKKLNGLGYPVVGLNAKTYFWTKKDPQKAANDISKILNQYMAEWKCKNFVMVGYSFGADVMPFLENRLPAILMPGNKHTILMSPSKTTDFEIHLLSMIGLNGNDGESVLKEIQRMKGPVTIFFGSDEDDFPVEEIRQNNVRSLKLPGGHHYDGNVDEVVRQIVQSIR